MSILTFALTCKKEEENQSDHSPVQSRSRTGGAHCRARHFGAIFQLHGYPSDSYEASEPASSPTARARAAIPFVRAQPHSTAIHSVSTTAAVADCGCGCLLQLTLTT